MIPLREGENGFNNNPFQHHWRADCGIIYIWDLGVIDAFCIGVFLSIMFFLLILTLFNIHLVSNGLDEDWTGWGRSGGLVSGGEEVMSPEGSLCIGLGWSGEVLIEWHCCFTRILISWLFSFLLFGLKSIARRFIFE